MSYVFTSESVTEGHPDKVCDYISDSLLDAYVAGDPDSHVAIETLVKGGVVVLGGEVTSDHSIHRDTIVREAIRKVGYTDPDEPFNADGVSICQYISKQSQEIGRKVDRNGDQGAGDQGIMFGFASRETDSLMPLPIHLAHRLSQGLAEDRKNGEHGWLRPDGKTQVSVLYEDHVPKEVKEVVVSTSHAASMSLDDIKEYVEKDLCPRILGDWYHDGITFHANPGGTFILGGPSADAGVTGRKIICDTYGGMGRHGGGAFSGKDPSKVDRSAAYFCRYVARQVIKEKLAEWVEIQVSYAIGETQPISVKVDTFGTGDDSKVESFVKKFDFGPKAIIEKLDLLKPIYADTVNYGHFGRPGFSWEE